VVEIRISKLDGGQRGVSIGLESLFLALELKGDVWSAKIIDLMTPPALTTSWAALQSLDKLLRSPRAKFIRESITQRFKDEGDKILDRIVALVQDHADEWQPVEEDIEPIAEKEPLPQLSGEEAAKVQQIFLCKKPLDELTPLLDAIIAGEDDNKKLFFTLCTSGKSPDPKDRDIILIKSTAGAGKTTLVNAILKCFRTKKVGRFTKTALDHSNLKGYEILYLQELGDRDQEDQGVSMLKFLSADDQGYTVELTVGSPSEGFTTIIKKIPPMTVVSSTTRVEIDPQFERRCWIINLDETTEQTNRVREFNSRVEMEKTEIALGIRSELSSDRAIRILKWVAEKIPKTDVAILFPDAFQSVLAANKLRSRGDYNKLLRLLKYYTRFCHISTPKLKTPKDKFLLFPTPEIALDILDVAWGPISLMTLGLDKRTEKLFEAFEANEVRMKGAAITPELRAELAKSVGYAPSTIRSYLNNMEMVGYLSSDEKKPKTYWLLESLESIKLKASALSLNSENRDYYMDEMQKEAQDNLRTLSLKLPEETQGHIQDIQDVYVRVHQNIFSDSDLGSSETPLPETDPNNRDNSEIAIDPEKDTENALGDIKPPAVETDLNNRDNSKVTIKHRDTPYDEAKLRALLWLKSPYNRDTQGWAIVDKLQIILTGEGHISSGADYLKRMIEEGILQTAPTQFGLIRLVPKEGP